MDFIRVVDEGDTTKIVETLAIHSYIENKRLFTNTTKQDTFKDVATKHWL